VRTELSKALGYYRVFVLDLVSLIHDDVFPLKLLELSHTDAHTFVCCETDIKLSREESFFENDLTFSFCTDKVAQISLGHPLFEFEFPIGNDCLWSDDEEFTFDLLKLTQES